MNNYKELKKVCTSFEKGFAAIEPLVQLWGTSNKPMKKVTKAIMAPDRITNTISRHDMDNAHLYLLSEFFQNPEAMGLLLGKGKTELTPKGFTALSYWKDNPAFWSYFTVKENLDGDFILIEDLLTGKEHILYSAAIKHLQQGYMAEELHYFCLMVPNRECLQIVGAIKSYRIPVSDLQFYCLLFAPSEGLKEIVSKHFVKFWGLDAVASKPIYRHKTYPLGFAWQPFTLPDFAISKLGGKWKTLTLETQQKSYIEKIGKNMVDLPHRELLDSDVPAMAGSIVRDNTTGSMALVTNTEVAYHFYATLLNRAYPELELPKAPSVFITAALLLATRDMNLPFPWKGFLKMIDHKEKQDFDHHKDHKEPVKKQSKEVVAEDEYDFDDEDRDTLMYELQDLYMKARLSNKKLDIDAICKVIKLDRETVEGMFREFDAIPIAHPFTASSEEEGDLREMAEYVTFTVSAKDKAYELRDLPMPKDAYGGYLYRDLTHSYLFTIKNKKKAQKQLVQLTNVTYAKEIERNGVLHTIEKLFTESFGRELNYPLLNTFFWILHHKGKTFVPLRSYAIEMLKWIPFPILQEYPAGEDFIESFSLFTHTVLCTRGICVLDTIPSAEDLTMGTYTIRATEAFFSLLKPADSYLF